LFFPNFIDLAVPLQDGFLIFGKFNKTHSSKADAVPATDVFTLKFWRHNQTQKWKYSKATIKTSAKNTKLNKSSKTNF
jgi:hypothetical protein